MTTRAKLSAEERDFFGLVARAAFTNPFSSERQELDRQLAGDGPSREQVIEQVIAEVETRIATLDREKRGSIGDYGADDASLVRPTILFYVFHQYLEEFDTLIRNQVAAGEKPCPVPFGRPAILQLTQRGFPEPTAIQYFGLFYQLRRAYYLIYQSLIGSSPSMSRLRLRLWQNVFTADVRWYEDHLWRRMEDFSTLLLGETGAGKGAAASAIGRAGFIPFDPGKGRFPVSFTDTFTSINLSQFSEALLESELFGHRKGAFTGAIEAHEGVFARCSPHGSIFLDEIGDVSLQAQIKLLKVLEEREFSPVGSHDRLRFEGRIIAATNHDVAALRAEGTFRDDFYYRLCSDCIEVPPLRQRIREDPRELGEMITTIVRRIVGSEDKALIEAILHSLERSPGTDYPWPGNVRELEQAVRRFLVNQVYEGEPRITGGGLRNELHSGMEDGTLTAQDLVAGYCALLYQQCRNYVEVAKQTGLDRRTVKKYIDQAPDE